MKSLVEHINEAMVFEHQVDGFKVPDFYTKPKTIKEIQKALNGEGSNVLVALHQKGSSYPGLDVSTRELRMEQYTSDKYALSNSGTGFGSAYSEEKVIENALTSDYIFLAKKTKMKKIFEFVKELNEFRFRFHPDSLTSKIRRSSILKTDTLVCCDGLQAYINFNLVRELRHPDEYPYIDWSEEPNSSRLQVVADYEREFERLGKLAKKAGITINIQAW